MRTGGNGHMQRLANLAGQPEANPAMPLQIRVPLPRQAADAADSTAAAATAAPAGGSAPAARVSARSSSSRGSSSEAAATSSSVDSSSSAQQAAADVFSAPTTLHGPQRKAGPLDARAWAQPWATLRHAAYYQYLAAWEEEHPPGSPPSRGLPDPQPVVFPQVRRGGLGCLACRQLGHAGSWDA